MPVFNKKGIGLNVDKYADNTTGLSPRTRVTPVFLFALVILLSVDITSRFICFAHACGDGTFLGFSFSQFRNYDFAFSLKMPSFFIYGIYGIVLTALVRFMIRNWTIHDTSLNFAWSMVCVGAVANIVDRLYLGYVRDFIHFGSGYFNLGDVWIVSGITFICLYSLRHHAENIS